MISATFIVPKLDWARLDVSPVLFAVAGDLAAIMRQRVKASQISPGLKPATVASKKRRGSIAPTVPLFDTGMLSSSITHRKGAAKQGAEIYIKKRIYGVHGVYVTKGGRMGWKRFGAATYQSATGRASGGAGGRGRAVSTVEVGYYHDLAGSGRSRIRRPFFYYTDADFRRVLPLRWEQGIKGCMKRAGIAK